MSRIRAGLTAHARVRVTVRPLLVLALAGLIGLGGPGSLGGPGGSDGGIEPRVASAAGPAAGPNTAPAARPAGWPSFLIGASYQGPAARSWRGDYWAWWADDLFDAQLVSADFARASAAGLNTIRLFVQLELLREIRDGHWSKLDTVLDLADQHGLRLIVTLGDYDEPRVATLARIDAAISARYAGRETILAYDLRNEPTFWMLQSAMYPNGQKPPLLSRQLLERYGEQAANHYIVAFRASDEGQRGPLAIPERFSEDEAYVYHNNWIISYRLAQEATDWSQRTGRSDLEFFGSPDAARWQPFMEALDTTYRAWIEPRVEAIRKGDPNAVITIGHHDLLMAALPANRMLDAISLHRYVSPGPDGLADVRRQLLALRGLYPDRPILLGEFGHRATEVGDERVAIEESATWLQLVADGFAGGLKWQLNDTRDGTDTMGLFRMDGSARPVAHAAASIAQLALTTESEGPGELTIAADAAGGTCYQYTRGELLALAGRCRGADSPIELLDNARQLFAARAADGSYLMRVTAPTRLSFRGGTSGARIRWVLSVEGIVLATLPPSGAGLVTIDLEAGRTYEVRPAS